MKALVKAKAEPGMWMMDVPDPKIGPHDVLIKIKKTSICGTDVHIYNWDEWAKQNIPVPLTIGHEFVGEIVELGREITQFKIGDRVSGENHIACRFCRCCRSGKDHLCRKNTSVGVNQNGACAEYLALPATNAYPIPDALSDDIAAILNPLGNSVHTALSFDVVGEDVLITGAGPVGLMAAAVARKAGARYVVISDVSQYRLDLAKKMQVDIAYNPNEIKTDQIMKKLGMKEGFDVGLEMSGNAHAFNSMINHMNHAGKVALLGFLPHETQIDWNQVIMKGLILKGIYGREMFETWYKMVCMLQSGLDISPVITHELKMDDYRNAFEIMRKGECGKIILSW